MQKRLNVLASRILEKQQITITVNSYGQISLDFIQQIDN